jgi:hypothetical protein
MRGVGQPFSRGGAGCQHATGPGDFGASGDLSLNSAAFEATDFCSS